jgi:hypothetical protein
MTRAQGKRNTPRTPEITDTGEGRDIGLSDRVLGTPSPIPGGEQHLLNHETMRQTVPVQVPRPEFRGTMAHGVPAEKHTAHERAATMRGPNTTHDPAPALDRPSGHPVAPVPVTIVQEGRDIRSLRTTSERRYVVPAFGGADPIRLIGRNSDRVQVLLLNEDATHHIRLSKTIAGLQIQHFGAVLPATTSSYLKLKTQDELYAISDDSGTPAISIIEEFERPQSEVQ